MQARDACFQLDCTAYDWGSCMSAVCALQFLHIDCSVARHCPPPLPRQGWTSFASRTVVKAAQKLIRMYMRILAA
eukprot:jgi/Botrbrau1/20175/Bobra.0173s0073.1